MRIIKIEPQKNGSHLNREGDNIFIPKEGWAIIPDDMELPSSFPFVNIQVKDQIVTSMIANEIPEKQIQQQLIEAQTLKVSELSAACNQTITSGIDVETTQGIEHFSLTETDQINLTNATLAVNQGAIVYPYHADGQLCRMFTAEELQDIAQTAIEFKIYQTTLCNHLLTWARRVTTIEELQQITYSANNLPEDLALNMQNVLTASASI